AAIGEVAEGLAGVPGAVADQWGDGWGEVDDHASLGTAEDPEGVPGEFVPAEVLRDLVLRAGLLRLEDSVRSEGARFTVLVTEADDVDRSVGEPEAVGIDASRGF